jgi:hypothetical protein
MGVTMPIVHHRVLALGGIDIVLTSPFQVELWISLDEAFVPVREAMGQANVIIVPAASVVTSSDANHVIHFLSKAGKTGWVVNKQDLWVVKYEKLVRLVVA